MQRVLVVLATMLVHTGLPSANLVVDNLLNDGTTFLFSFNITFLSFLLLCFYYTCPILFDYLIVFNFLIVLL